MPFKKSYRILISMSNLAKIKKIKAKKLKNDKNKIRLRRSEITS